MRHQIQLTVGAWEKVVQELGNLALFESSDVCSPEFQVSNLFFTITAEIHARSLANFYCQYADRHMNLKFMRRVSVREPVIRQFVIVKNKLMSVFNASVLLLIMNFVITLSE